MVGKKEKKAKAKLAKKGAKTGTTAAPAPAKNGYGGTRKGKTNKTNEKKAPKIKYIPTIAAVVLTAVDNAKVTVADALAKIKNNIDLRSKASSRYVPEGLERGRSFTKSPVSRAKRGQISWQPRFAST